MNNDDKKHTIYDSGFDQLLNRTGVVEENERQFQARIKEERDERDRRERIRIQRIAASGKDPLLYSLDEIIRKCVIHQGMEQIEIPLQDLGFQYSIAGAVEAHRFFNQLRDDECFESVERSANVYFYVSKPNIERLRDYKSGLERKLGVIATKSSGTEDPKTKSKVKSSENMLHLNSVGDLWREPKKKYCYSMSEDGNRHKIVRYLAKNRGYQQTFLISQEIDGKNEQVIRTEIQKINSNFKKHIGAKMGKLIKGKKDSGYQIIYPIKIDESLIRS